MLQVLIRIAGIPFLLWIVAKVCIQLIPIILFTLGLLIMVVLFTDLMKLVWLVIPNKVLEGIITFFNKPRDSERPGVRLTYGIILTGILLLLLPPACLEYYLFIGEISQWVVGFLSVGILR